MCERLLIVTYSLLTVKVGEVISESLYMGWVKLSFSEQSDALQG